MKSNVSTILRRNDSCGRYQLAQEPVQERVCSSLQGQGSGSVSQKSVQGTLSTTGIASVLAIIN